MLPQLAHKEPVKFVGDLNPESVLTDLTTRQKGSPKYNRIGVWVEQSRFEQEQFRRQQENAARNGSLIDTDPAAKKAAATQRYAKVERGRRTLTGHQKNYLQSVGALRVLPKITQDVLVTTYVACIDPLLPIIDCNKLLQDYKNGTSSNFLVLAMCMVACKTEEAVPYLKLYEEGSLMDPIPFARALHTGLDAAMKADLEADRFTKVQILTLMSLHNDGPGGIEESSMHLVMAIHDGQTTGLHINTPGRTLNDQGAMLWWTLWTLDKFNACLGGRPLVIADRDIDIKRPNLEPNPRSQVMAVWLAMGDLLDQIIEYYRPAADQNASGWEGDFPSFEDLTAHCQMDMLQENQRNLLEVCYNIIGILACRAGGPMSRSYNRRIASADRIQQLTTGGKQSRLPPLPLVPYAVSLSLTVAYRGLRDSHCDPVKTQSDLAARCVILENFNKTWWTADAMAKLGRKALKSIQQPASSDDGSSKRKSPTELDVGDTLDAEVAVCKYGPFDKKTNEKRPNSSSGATSSRPGKQLARSNSDDDNGLQVLSHAAASLHKERRDPPNLSNITSKDSNTINPRSAHITSSKRPRPNSDSSVAPNSSVVHGLSNLNVFAMDTPSSTHGVSTLTNTPAQTPHTNPNFQNASNNVRIQHSDGVYNINPDVDPFCATGMVEVDASNLPTASTSISTSNNLTSFMSPRPSFYNPRLSVPLHHSGSYSNNPSNTDIDPSMDLGPGDYAFNALDTLFDGFFDLSMPTMFNDPVYEGAAYDLSNYQLFGSGGHSGAGSVDMNYAGPSGYMSQGGFDTGMSGMGSGQAPVQGQRSGM